MDRVRFAQAVIEMAKAQILDMEREIACLRGENKRLRLQLQRESNERNQPTQYAVRHACKGTS